MDVSVVIAIENKGSGQRTGYDCAEPTDMLMFYNIIIRMGEPDDFRNFYFFFLISVMIII